MNFLIKCGGLHILKLFKSLKDINTTRINIKR